MFSRFQLFITVFEETLSETEKAQFKSKPYGEKLIIGTMDEKFLQEVVDSFDGKLMVICLVFFTY